MNVSKRLNRLARMVTEGYRLADVGTDHGYVPILLINEKRIPSAIAMDVNKGPLKRADDHIAEYGLEKHIKTRLSDGLAALREGEADTVLIAGMGGPLTVRILSEGQHVLGTVKELILQPQSEIAEVRRWLFENGWNIICEDILLDEGKYYPMMKAVPAEACTHAGVQATRNLTAYTEEEFCFGKLAFQKSPEILREFLQKSLQVQEQIAASLPDSDEERIRSRRQEVEQEKKRLKKVLEECI